MPDIVTGRIFVDGEKGITAGKLNDIVGSSVIQPAFYANKPTASIVDQADTVLILKSGAYAQAPFSAVTSSVNASQVWAVRLRSFNAAGNPTFEVDQRTVGTLQSPVGGATWLCDRWAWSQGPSAGRVQTQRLSENVVVPGTSFNATTSYLRIKVSTAQSVLAAGDYFVLGQTVEGPQFRELQSDVHSMSLLVRSSAPNWSFGLSLVDNVSAKVLAKVCQIGAANTWQLITLPNLPLWQGTYASGVGQTAYFLNIVLAAGSSLTVAANDTWQSSSGVGAATQSNFMNLPNNSSIDIAFVQHEPGAVCSTLMDKPFVQNLAECQRHYFKSYDYAVKPGTAANTGGAPQLYVGAGQHAYGSIRFPDRMSKFPAVNGWSTVTGAKDIVRDTSSNTERGVSSPVNVGETGFSGFQLITPNASASVQQFHYTVDTSF